MDVSSDPTFAVILRQYPDSVSVLRILQPEGGDLHLVLPPRRGGDARLRDG